MPPSNFKSPFVFIASTFEERGALAVPHHHSNWTWLLWAAPENPRTAPSPGLPGIRVLHRSWICISSSDFPCDGFSRSKPAGASRLGYTRASISKAIRTERKPVDFFSPHFLFSLNNVAEPPRAGKLRTFWVTDISVAHLRRQTRVFWARRKG